MQKYIQICRSWAKSCVPFPEISEIIAEIIHFQNEKFICLFSGNGVFPVLLLQLALVQAKRGEGLELIELGPQRVLLLVYLGDLY